MAKPSDSLSWAPVLHKVTNSNFFTSFTRPAIIELLTHSAVSLCLTVHLNPCSPGWTSFLPLLGICQDLCTCCSLSLGTSPLLSLSLPPLPSKHSCCLFFVFCLSTTYVVPSGHCQNALSSGAFPEPPSLDYFHRPLVMPHLSCVHVCSPLHTARPLEAAIAPSLFTTISQILTQRSGQSQ